MKHSDLKKFFLRCWVKLARFLQWVEKHPNLDKIVLAIARMVLYILDHK